MDEARNDRWWPVGNDTMTALRDADSVYAVLGPITALRLIKLHDAAKDSGIAIDDDVAELISRLRLVVGRGPEMLALMAVAVGLAGNMMRRSTIDAASDADERPLFPWEMFRQWNSSVYKLFGWQVEEMLRKFHFGRDELIEMLQAGPPFGEESWPPTGAHYAATEPESVSRPVPPGGPGPLAPWRAIQESIGRPTLHGASEVRFSDLQAYVHILSDAVRFLDDDLRLIEKGGGSSDVRQHVLTEVAAILRAKDDIDAAQRRLAELMRK